MVELQKFDSIAVGTRYSRKGGEARYGRPYDLTARDSEYGRDPSTGSMKTRALH